MAEHDLVETRNYYSDVPVASTGFHVRGANSLDWGAKNRLSRIFNPKSGKTVMFAVDHGYFQGPTTVLRATGGPSILQDLTNERVAVTMEDAIRINASAVAVQMFIGSENETQSLRNLTKLVDEGMRYGIPVIGVVAVGKEMSRDARYFRLACRIGAELGAQIIKVYYTEEEFDSIVSTCPVPIVVAGGKKIGELEALVMAERSIAEGAAGVDMGRNIFQSMNPQAMIKAVRTVVHEGATAKDAFALFTELSN